jgi:hypothetical protein
LSVRKIHLRKLLKCFYLPDAPRRSLLRADIRNEIQKDSGADLNGGDFHMPFWTDAKNHVAGGLDLKQKSKLRIDSNKGRGRLYPLLTSGFLNWWNEKRRWRNEEFKFIEDEVYGRLTVPEVNGVIKVENLLAVRIGDETNKVIYPYFAEEPILPPEGARIGLWVMSQTLMGYALDDLRILDILREKSFATRDYPLFGNEQTLFLQKYQSLVKEWDELWKEY